MGIFYWNQDKNLQIQAERNLSFEQILYAIENNHLLDILKHPNQAKYRDQILLVVRIQNYIVLVPAVETNQGLFLKTAFPSRKMTKKYLEGK